MTSSCLDSAEALIDCGRQAQDANGDLQAGRRWFEAAYQEAERIGDIEAMAEAALGLGGVWVHEHRTAAGAGRLHARLTYVLALLDPGSDLALRVRARLAGENDYRTGQHANILAMLDQARLCADPIVRAEALSFAHHCVLGPDHGSLRRRLAEELVGEGARTGRRSDLLMGLLWQTVDHFLDGDPHAERRLGELRSLLAVENHLAIGFVVAAIEVMLAIRAGRLDDAELLAKECAERGAEAGDADANAWFGAQLVAIRWYQGRLPELLPLLTEMVHSPTLSAVDNSYFAAIALAAAMDGDRRTASGALAVLRGRNLAHLPRSSSWLVTMYGVVEAANVLDNAMAAARAYELLRPFAHLPMTASLGVACFGSVHLALGVAALTMNNLDRAVSHLREAVQANLALGHWPAVVAARRRFAEALERRGGADDLAAAREQRAIADELAAAFGISGGAGPTNSTELGAPTGFVHCVRQGRQWRVDLGHRSVLVEHSVGLLHLAVLTANPGAEIAAIDLVAGVDGLGQAARGSLLSAQPMLDRAAVQGYRQRLAQLAEEIDHAATAGAADQARVEREWLLSELSAGTGMGGRARAFADSTERARLAVGKAIRRAVQHIDQVDSVIGAHLRTTVHTGVRCWYRP